jgi:hypothetical protein
MVSGVTRIAGWSSLVARQAHNLKVVGSNPTPATNLLGPIPLSSGVLGLLVTAFAGVIYETMQLKHGNLTGEQDLQDEKGRQK